MSEFKLLIKVILSISCWHRNYKYNDHLDKWYRSKLSQGERFKIIDEYTATFAGKTIWVSNHPYASFCLYGNNNFCLPSRRTVILLWERFSKDNFDHEGF